MAKVRYEVVTVTESGGLRAAYFFSKEALIQGMAALCARNLGACEQRGIRAELKGHPMFTGFCGPMWGGVVKADATDPFDFTVRYESDAAEAVLSSTDAEALETAEVPK